MVRRCLTPHRLGKQLPTFQISKPDSLIECAALSGRGRAFEAGERPCTLTFYFYPVSDPTPDEGEREKGGEMRGEIWKRILPPWQFGQAPWHGAVRVSHPFSPLKKQRLMVMCSFQLGVQQSVVRPAAAVAGCRARCGSVLMFVEPYGSQQ